MIDLSDKRHVLALVAILLVALLATQAATQWAAPSGGIASTGRIMGKTGFAYIGGVRTFAAAVIWNRLDPLFHKYYSGKSLSQLSWALPAMNLVQILDPQFLQAYYEASFNVYRMGAKAEGMRIARLGVTNNPKSGFMRANLVQMLMIEDRNRNLTEMVKNADVGLKQDMYWSSEVDLYESLAIFRVAYSLDGNKAKVAMLDTRLKELRDSGVDVGDHDHDGDGEQDH